MAPFGLRLIRAGAATAGPANGLVTGGLAAGGLAAGGFATGGFATGGFAGTGLGASILLGVAGTGVGTGFRIALDALGFSFDFNKLSCFTPALADLTAGAGLAAFLGCAFADFDPAIHPPDNSTEEI